MNHRIAYKLYKWESMHLVAWDSSWEFQSLEEALKHVEKNYKDSWSQFVCLPVIVLIPEWMRGK